jgi:hypothetical protein
MDVSPLRPCFDSRSSMPPILALTHAHVLARCHPSLVNLLSILHGRRHPSHCSLPPPILRFRRPCLILLCASLLSSSGRILPPLMFDYFPAPLLSSSTSHVSGDTRARGRQRDCWRPVARAWVMGRPGCRRQRERRRLTDEMELGGGLAGG